MKNVRYNVQEYTEDSGEVRLLYCSRAQYDASWQKFAAQLGESDHVTIDTKDVQGRKLTESIQMQQSFGSMFTMI